MYNSSIKGQGRKMQFKEKLEIPHKVFFNDMSKNYMCEEFRSCDVIYSEISWIYGYKGFNEKANNEPSTYNDYVENINKLIVELNKPAFIICGKNVSDKFPSAKMFPIKINSAGTNMDSCTLYVCNYDYYDEGKEDTQKLTDFLAEHFNKCLDFSCGYGEHLLKFKDFIGCDIDRNCLTYLSILVQEKEKNENK